MFSDLQSRQRSAGIAVISVLLILALLVIVAVGMLTASRMNSRSSVRQEVQVSLASLQDSAINLSIGQLREATSQQNQIWSSQPGAVRTFASAEGIPIQIFKLYSDDQMVVSATSDPNLFGDLVTDWNSVANRAQYVDLNRPGIDAEGVESFPIIDPHIVLGAGGASATDDPPEGFSYSADAISSASGAPTAIGGVLEPGDAGAPAAGAVGQQGLRLPMPVKWIYSLADGSLGTLDGSNEFVGFAGQASTTATAANPMVGRFAFWCDDESSKVNINTASESLPWDTPRCVTPDDVSFAIQPPVLNEVQRYPGHPAATCLSSVLFPGKSYDGSGFYTELTGTELASIYDLTPRVNGDSGLSAVLTQSDPFKLSRVTYDADPLYNSVDELVLQNDLSSGKRDTLYPPELLAGRRFFLTANSRSPELTPNGRPKVALWPIHYDEGTGNDGDTNYRTAYDKLVQFATTLGEFGTDQPYAVQRRVDTSDQRGEYWSASGSDADELAQAQAIPLYLARNLGFDPSQGDGALSAPTPGYGVNFFDKYTAENMSFNALNFLEYIRTTNIADDTVVDNTRVTSFSHPKNDQGTYRVGEVSSNNARVGFFTSPSADMTNLLKRFNLDDRGTWTVGRRHAVNEVAMIFTRVVERGTGDTYQPVGQKAQDLGVALGLKENQAAIQVGILPEMACVAVGYPSINPVNSFSFALKNSTQFLVDGQPMQTSVGGTVQNWIGFQASTKTKTLNNGTMAVNFPDPGHFSPTSEAHASKGHYHFWHGLGGSGDYRLMTSGTDKSGHPMRCGTFRGHGDDTTRNTGFFIVDTTKSTMTVELPESANFMFGSNGQNRNVNSDNDKQHSGTNHLDGVVTIPIPELPADSNLRIPFQDRVANLASQLGNTASGDTTDYIDVNDVVRSFVLEHGDSRIGLVRGNFGWKRNGLWGDANLFAPHNWNDPTTKHIHSLYKGTAPLELGTERAKLTPLVPAVTYALGTEPDFAIPALLADGSPNPPFVQSLTDMAAITGDPVYPYTTAPHLTRDWDNGPGSFRDGAYSNLPNYGSYPGTDVEGNAYTPYFDSHFDIGAYDPDVNADKETTKPNALVPSAAMFGSLPSMAMDFVPWTTFLFRPELDEVHAGASGRSRASTGTTVAGTTTRTGTPPDHMLLEYFWMPIVAPYAISEPFATAGKVNMNYRLAPFSHIRRATGLHAVMKSERILAIPTTEGGTYKVWPDPDVASGSTDNPDWREPIDIDTTLRQWEDRFDAGDYFRTPSEVCEQFLVPNGATVGTDLRASMLSFWDDHQLTGDNTMERPYANIYPRLCTRSNAFRVHFISQTLKKLPTTNPEIWVEGTDRVTGERQGDALIERHIDPLDPEVNPSSPDFNTDYDFANNPDPESLDGLYAYRVRHIRRFVR